MKFLVYVLSVFILCSVFLIPHATSAHEVYVLSASEIQNALIEPSVSPITVITDNMEQFFIWLFIVPLTILIIFFISISQRLEKFFDPFLIKLKPFAPIISRVTIGLSFIAGAYYQASYGPELPLTSTYGSYAPIAIGLLYIIGICILLGFWTRLSAFIALVMFSINVYFHGTYMLTYVNYLGEIILLLLAGAGTLAVQKSAVTTTSYKRIEQFGIFISRILFGVALIFA